MMSSFAPKKDALLLLENGSVFYGKAFGYRSQAIGEICFNTSMSGYQEVITDPSYRKQIIVFSYPMIGNYGVHKEESESDAVQAAAVIVREYIPRYSNFRAQQSLEEFLIEHKTPAIQGIDTRKLILMIRKEGAQNGAVFPATKANPSMLASLRAHPKMEGLDLALQAGTKEAYYFGRQEGKLFRLAVLDFGIKRSILRCLDELGFAVEVFPPKTNFAAIQEKNFHAYFLSNGPGDPGALDYAIATTRSILREKKPTFGICLGHQIIALACGYERFKLKFGHRGSNQPVYHKERSRVEITSQNHGFAIKQKQDSDGLQIMPRIETTHFHLNDQSIAGFCGKDQPLMCVQYHPEASPGPHDSRYLFQSFFAMVKQYYAE